MVLLLIRDVPFDLWCVRLAYRECAVPRLPIELSKIRRLLAYRDLFQENQDLRREVNRNYDPDHIVGRSAGMQQVFGASASCFGAYQSLVHSQTLPIMSLTP